MSRSTLSDFARRHDELEAEIYEKRAKRAENARRRAGQRARAFGDLCEATEGLATVWRREETPFAKIFDWVDGDMLALNALIRWMRYSATREIDRLRHAERRPFYYQQEKLRRQALAAERRRIARRTTTNPCPTKEQILDAWEKVGQSNEDVLRFGSLLEDLACYVDSSLIRAEDGAIVGRRGGVKAWLQLNIPALYLKYKTVMAYKAAARKLRQITGLADSVPVARLVEKPCEHDSLDLVRARAVYQEIIASPFVLGVNDCVVPDKVPQEGRKMGRPREEGEEKRRLPESRTAWLRRVEAFADPERVTEVTTLAEWKRWYDGKITVRTKSV